MRSNFFQNLVKVSVYRFTSNNSNRYNDVIAQLKSIKQENGGDIYSDGFIKNIEVSDNGDVKFDLKLTQNYRKIKQLSQEALEKLPWLKTIDIRMAPKEVSTETKPFRRGNMEKIQKIIAVSSCKGGVGKSTVALNLAFSLHKMGKKIGIFDADIYGPSLPTLLAKEKETLEAPEDNPKFILPVEYEGVKAMSYGFASGGQKAVLRGPMVSGIVTQLAYQTIWGELDYLVVDMPPGTGDIQITICQELKLDAAVIVTTPQRLSFVDVVKGIEMFDVLKVPTVAVVENMAEFECQKCGHHHRPFGPGYLNLLQKQFGIKNSCSIPLIADISKYSDLGSPVVMTLPEESTITQIYHELAQGVNREVKLLKEQTAPHVRYDTGSRNIILRNENGKETKINSNKLRAKCGCALCIDEWTGKQILNVKKIPDDVYPFKIEPKGNYAVAIIWSDGHKSSIYPYERLLSEEFNQDK